VENKAILVLLATKQSLHSFTKQTVSLTLSLFPPLHFRHRKHLRLIFIPSPCASNACSLRTVGQRTLFRSFNYIAQQWEGKKLGKIPPFSGHWKPGQHFTAFSPRFFRNWTI